MENSRECLFSQLQPNCWSQQIQNNDQSTAKSLPIGWTQYQLLILASEMLYSALTGSAGEASVASIYWRKITIEGPVLSERKDFWGHNTTNRNLASWVAHRGGAPLICFWPQFEVCMTRTLNPAGKGLEELQHPSKALTVWKKAHSKEKKKI